MSILFKKWKKRSFILLLAFVLLNPLVGLMDTNSTVHAEEVNLAAHPSKSLTLDSAVTDWVYDENAGSIYAISKTTNKLFFIDAENLAIEKELLVGSYPSDIEQHGDKLYIALSGASAIQVVDAASQSLSSQLATSGQPKNVAITSDFILYSTLGTGSDQIFRMNRADGTSTKLMSTGYMGGTVISADEQRHTLYIGETDSTGSKLIAVDYLTDKIVSSDTYDGDYGFGFPYPKILLDGTDVFFGGSRLNGSNLAEIHGAYPRFENYEYLDSHLLDLSGPYVATSQAIFDKEQYVKIADFPYEAGRAIIGMNGRVFLQDKYGDNKTIEAFDLNLSVPLPTLTLTDGIGSSIISNYKMDSWTTSDETPYIYLTSSQTNELAVIRKDDFSLVAKRYVGSKPISVSLLGGNLFFAFRGETNLGVLSTSDIQSKITRISIPSNPEMVLPAQSRTFYWGQDTFKTFHVTDGVTDKPVFPGSDNANFGSAYYDSSESSLYAGDGDKLFKLNADTLAVTASQNVTGYSCPGSLIIDGDSLYYCKQRMAKNTLSTVWGTYPEAVIYAHDNFVFSANAIYDRDTYVSQITLPFAITDAYISGGGEIYLSTANQIFKFADIEAIRDYIATNMVPSDAHFIDEGDAPGQINGQLLFKPAEDRDSIERYETYFINDAGDKLGPVGYSWEQSFVDGYLVYKVYGTNIPQNAKYIGVYAIPKNRSLKESLPAKALIWDVPNCFAENFSFTDQDPDQGFVQGTVSWIPRNEYSDLTYHLYFVGDSGLIGDEITKVNGNKPSYAYNMPKTIVPENALGLALVQKSGESVSPVFQYLIFKEFITPELLPSDITLVKNRIAEDTVTVRNIQAGDLINIYSKSNQLIGSGKAADNQTSITIKIGNFGNPGDTLLITRSTPGKFESDGTIVTIPPVTNDGGSGGGGGGGGPIVIPGPGSPGGVIIDGTDEAAEGLKAVVVKDNSGKAIAKIDVPTDYMATQLKDKNFDKTKTVSLISDSSESSVVFHIPLSGIQELAQASNDGILEISTPNGLWSINAKALLDSVGENKNAKTFNVTIEELDAAGTVNLTKHLAKGSQLLGKPMKFEVTVTDGSKTNTIENFSQYANHSIRIPMTSVTLKELAGLMFDPELNIFVPVPVKFTYENGILTASLFRKGNSVYTIVKNKTVFKDLPKEQAHAESIQALANRMVFNGFPDGTFKPKNKVTRAEFAVMLNKALGIKKSTNSNGTVFKDVLSASWYAGDVKAAVEAGIITGYEDGSFKPNQTISHEEIVVLLVKAMHYAGYSAAASSSQGNSLPDSTEVPAWAQSYYDEAKKSGLLGRTNDLFVFKTNIEATREDCALLLFRVVNDILFQ